MMKKLLHKSINVNSCWMRHIACNRLKRIWYPMFRPTSFLIPLKCHNFLASSFSVFDIPIENHEPSSSAATMSSSEILPSYNWSPSSMEVSGLNPTTVSLYGDFFLSSNWHGSSSVIPLLRFDSLSNVLTFSVLRWKLSCYSSVEELFRLGFSHFCLAAQARAW